MIVGPFGSAAASTPTVDMSAATAATARGAKQVEKRILNERWLNASKDLFTKCKLV